jgi:16S rRNA processing protein RimM
VSEPDDEAPAAQREVVVIGEVTGAHGVSGWVRVHSLTEPREAIFEYRPWLLGDRLEEARVSQSRTQGNRLVALLEGTDDRAAAEALAHRQIAVYRDQLPELPRDRYYWIDLVGLAVRLADGRELGRIEKMLATGANDVMVVRGERERLIPFVPGPYVKQVDLEAGTVVVDWDPDF